MRDPEQRRWLLIESGGHACALPLANVLETMRPLPIEALTNAPEFVLGLAVIRGASVPVVDLAAVLVLRAARLFPDDRALARSTKELV